MAQIPPPHLNKDPRTHAIIGAAMQVHRNLGCGFLEAVYHEVFALELTERGIPFQSQVELPIYYKNKKLKTTYKADFICFGSAIVELKALAKMGGAEEAQVINYLKATGFEIGLLINFGKQSLEYRRFIHTK